MLLTTVSNTKFQNTLYAAIATHSLESRVLSGGSVGITDFRMKIICRICCRLHTSPRSRPFCESVPAHAQHVNRKGVLPWPMFEFPTFLFILCICICLSIKRLWTNTCCCEEKQPCLCWKSLLHFNSDYAVTLDLVDTGYIVTMGGLRSIADSSINSLHQFASISQL